MYTLGISWRSLEFILPLCNVAKIPDVRVISAIVPPGCVVRPIGSKQGLALRILGGKDVRPGSAIAGLRDRDFDDDDSLSTGNPRNWFIINAAKQISLGWYWERKEIENYLIDPKVVKRSLGDNAPPASDYRLALQQSADKIAVYTAARITLSLYLSSRPSPPDNTWGKNAIARRAIVFPRTRD